MTFLFSFMHDGRSWRSENDCFVSLTRHYWHGRWLCVRKKQTLKDSSSFPSKSIFLNFFNQKIPLIFFSIPFFKLWLKHARRNDAANFYHHRRHLEEIHVRDIESLLKSHTNVDQVSTFLRLATAAALPLLSWESEDVQCVLKISSFHLSSRWWEKCCYECVSVSLRNYHNCISPWVIETF